MDTATDEKPRRGRPPGDEPGSTVSAWLPVSVHDKVVRNASARRQSVSQYVRDIIEDEIEPSSC